MEKSQDQGVQELLDELQEDEPEKFALMQALRKITLEIYPEVKERIMYGGIMFTLKEDFGGLFPSKKHVSYEFSLGIGLKDPKALLEGKGKLRRHLKFKVLADIEIKTPKFFVEQVSDL